MTDQTTTQQTTVSSDLNKAIGDLAKSQLKVLNRYAPAGNVHEPELKAKYLSVSQLVYKSATEYAQHILAGSPDDGDPFYSFKGNTLAEEALADIASHEIQFKVGITGQDWVITGHCDGIETTPSGVVVHEHKAHGKPTPMKRELARRQALLYLSMGNRMANILGVRDFTSAAYKAKIESFTWPKGAPPLGVVISISPEVAPPLSTTLAVNDKQCEEHLEFYLAKAVRIVHTIKTGDFKLVTEWDQSPAGLAEKRQDMVQTAPELAVVEKLLAEYREISSQDFIIYARKEEIKAQVRQFMSAMGNVKNVEIGNYTAKIIDMKESTQVRKAHQQLRISGGEE